MPLGACSRSPPKRRSQLLLPRLVSSRDPAEGQHRYLRQDGRSGAVQDTPPLDSKKPPRYSGGVRVGPPAGWLFISGMGGSFHRNTQSVVRPIRQTPSVLTPFYRQPSRYVADERRRKMPSASVLNTDALALIRARSGSPPSILAQYSRRCYPVFFFANTLGLRILSPRYPSTQPSRQAALFETVVKMTLQLAYPHEVSHRVIPPVLCGSAGKVTLRVGDRTFD